MTAPPVLRPAGAPPLELGHTRASRRYLCLGISSTQLVIAIRGAGGVPGCWGGGSEGAARPGEGGGGEVVDEGLPTLGKIT